MLCARMFTYTQASTKTTPLIDHPSHHLVTRTPHQSRRGRLYDLDKGTTLLDDFKGRLYYA